MNFPAVVCSVTLLVATTTVAQEPTSSTPATVGDIKLIRQILEQQSRQIETLTQQVERLVQLLQERHAAAPTVGTTPLAADMPPNPVSEPVPILPATPARRTHVVIKGESFSSIAEKYGISITELMKLNPMQDPRKMQIGQTLILPIEETPPDINAAPVQATTPVQTTTPPPFQQ